MINGIRAFVFRLYEQTGLRNWFYTLAFAIVVPTGFRFAVVAWEHGEWYDKPLAMVAGTLIGVTSLVTLLRVWEVPPRQTTETPAEPVPPEPYHPAHIDVLSGSRRMSARNRQIAREAASLGSTRR